LQEKTRSSDVSPSGERVLISRIALLLQIMLSPERTRMLIAQQRQHPAAFSEQ